MLHISLMSRKGARENHTDLDKRQAHTQAHTQRNRPTGRDFIHKARQTSERDRTKIGSRTTVPYEMCPVWPP